MCCLSLSILLIIPPIIGDKASMASCVLDIKCCVHLWTDILPDIWLGRGTEMGQTGVCRVTENEE